MLPRSTLALMRDNGALPRSQEDRAAVLRDQVAHLPRMADLFPHPFILITGGSDDGDLPDCLV